jgi:hypothetical protein
MYFAVIMKLKVFFTANIILQGKRNVVLQGLNVRSSSTWSSQLMHRVEKSGGLLMTSIHVRNSYLIITDNMRSWKPGGLLLTSVHVRSSYWVIMAFASSRRSGGFSLV